MDNYKTNSHIPWRITADFDKQQHLFSKTETNYLVDAFICSCGHKDFIIYKNRRVDYICPVCKNRYFYDANNAIVSKNNLGYYLKENPNLKIDHTYRLCVDNKKVKASVVIYIPSGIDFLRKKIVFTSIEKESLEFYFEGELKKNYIYPKNSYSVYAALENMITEYIEKNRKALNIPLSSKKITLNEAIFFLKNRHLKSIEFYHWNDLHRFPKNRDLTLKDAFDVIINKRKESSLKKHSIQTMSFNLKNINDTTPLW